MTIDSTDWRKSNRSGQNGDCVEVKATNSAEPGAPDDHRLA